MTLAREFFQSHGKFERALSCACIPVSLLQSFTNPFETLSQNDAETTKRLVPSDSAA